MRIQLWSRSTSSKKLNRRPQIAERFCDIGNLFKKTFDTHLCWQAGLPFALQPMLCDIKGVLIASSGIVLRHSGRRDRERVDNVCVNGCTKTLALPITGHIYLNTSSDQDNQVCECATIGQITRCLTCFHSALSKFGEKNSAETASGFSNRLNRHRVPLKSKTFSTDDC